MGVWLLLSGCAEDKGPAGPVDVSLTGTMSGTVILYSASGSAEPDHGGVLVWIEVHAETTLTNSEGKWRFEEVPAGTWTIDIVRPGYGHMKLPKMKLNGGGAMDLDSTRLSAPPTFGLEWVGVGYTPASGTLNVIGKASDGSPSDRPVVVFIGGEPITSAAPRRYIDTLRASVDENLNSFVTRTIDIVQPPYGFGPGDSIFVMVCPVSMGLDGYVDPESGLKVYTTGISALSRKIVLRVP
jgi:hypothetical protein